MINKLVDLREEWENKVDTWIKENYPHLMED